MSYPHQAPPRRPGAVVSAAALLLLMAVGAVAYAVANLLVTAGTVDRFREAARATGAGSGEIDGVASLLRGSTVLSAVLGVLVALLLVGLALGLLSGRGGARVTTWVVAGLGLFCGCCGLAVLVGQRAAPLRLGADDRVTADLLARVGDAYPGWWIPVNAAVSVAQILGYLVVAALLTLPTAGAFFHRRPPRPAGPVPPAGPAPAYGPPPASTPPAGPPAPGYYGPPAPAHGQPSPWAPPTAPVSAPPPGTSATPPPSAPPGPTPPPEDRP
ncbi:hypothetical protein [Micromonospora chersina]|uniref:Uncharacterized protein n=1 Tax=Micromonospora chersina TaxID=47854 RepID=A0A1C6VEX0_9ACTN|nr:hypothetical protein GA0070603_3832 [Micromonospora chersina]